MLDTKRFILRHQVLDLGAVGGGVTLSGIEAREIIEDFLADALVEGDNISIIYTDVPSPGIVTIGTTASLSINNLTASGTISFGTISGTGDIYCNDLYTSGDSIHLGDLRLSHNGSIFNIPSDTLISGSLSMPADSYIKTLGSEIEIQIGTDYSGFYYLQIGSNDRIWMDGTGYSFFGDNNTSYIEFDENNNVRINSNIYGDVFNLNASLWSIGYNTSYIRFWNDDKKFIFNAGAGGGSNLEFDAYNLFYGSATISGTGDIYCNNLYTEGNLFYLGDHTEIREESGSMNFYRDDVKRISIGDGGGSIIIGAKDADSDSGVEIGTGAFYVYFNGQTVFELGETYHQFGDTDYDNIQIHGSGQGDYMLFQIGEPFATSKMRLDANGLTLYDNLLFGANTVSGTGDIYCNDIFTSGSTVHIGDVLELSADDVGNLSVNYGIVVDGVDSSLEFTGDHAMIGLSSDPSLVALVSGTLSLGGNLELLGTCSGIEYDPIYWDDVRMPGLQVQLAGFRDPDLVKFKDNGVGSYGVYWYQFDASTNEEVHFSIQLPHAYKEDSDIYPHIHWSPTTSGIGTVRWGFEYSWANVNDIFPTNTTLIYIEADADGEPFKHQVAALPSIDGTNKNISSMLMCRLFRWADHSSGDTYDDDAGFLEFDIHYQIDTPGSRQQYIK